MGSNQQPPLRVWLSWSSGKDCAYTLHTLRLQSDVEVVGLLTTVNERFDRVAMHAVRCQLLQEQAAAVGLPVHEVCPCHLFRHIKHSVLACINVGNSVCRSVLQQTRTADQKCSRPVEHVWVAAGLGPYEDLLWRCRCVVPSKQINGVDYLCVSIGTFCQGPYAENTAADMLQHPLHQMNRLNAASH
jgi:hypothetical protein